RDGARARRTGGGRALVSRASADRARRYARDAGRGDDAQIGAVDMNRRSSRHPGGAMRLLTALFATVLLVATVCGRAYAADADPHAEDRQALLKVFREIEAAINAQDVDRMVANMHPTATVTWLNGEVSRGHAEIKAYYHKMVQGDQRILDKYTTDA